jgi:OmpA-OmpF porin, OOP family
MTTRSMMLGVFTLALALPRLGEAQVKNGANIDLNAFRPAMDSRGFVTVNASQVLGHKEISFGLVSTWRRGLFKLKNGDNEYVVSNIINPTLIAAFGLRLGLLEIESGLSFPLVLVNGDRAPDFEGMPGPNDDQNFRFDGQGLGDMGLHAKIRILNTSRRPRIGLAVIGSLYLPTASDEDRWLGDKTLTPQVIGVVDKETRGGRFKFAVNAGIRLPSETSEFVDNQPVMADMGPDISTGGRISNARTIPFGAAVAYAVAKQKFDLIAETYGSLPLESGSFLPLEGILAAKVYLARNSFLSLGGGVGILDMNDPRPDARAFIAIVFEPNIGDRDGDGIKDDVDQCPDNPEDYDDFEDEDGCPDPDNDRDGILDEDDDCPNEPEDKDGVEDHDGCPERDQNDRDGDGILDDVDKCPDDPEDFDDFEDEDGCPDPDNDKDGILDVDDLCPNDPEDKDGFQDEDGCPDPDNDKDRILDADDACPNEPETYNGFEDQDGCPDRGRVVVTDTKIEILDKIFFEYNKDIIKSESFPILDAIVATLQGNPDIARIEIQGHTDSRGSDSYNLDLSDRRAAAVRRYMVNAGVNAKRLESHGYGETQPLDKRNNEEAWAKNRRVEFLILKRTGD